MEKTNLANKHSKQHFYIIGHIVLAIVLVLSVLFMNVIAVRIINKAKVAMFSELSENIGFQIDYDRISPNILTSIDIYNVTLTDGKDTEIRLGNVELEYSLLRLFGLHNNPKGIFSLIKAMRLKSLSLDVTEAELRSTISRVQAYLNEHKKSGPSNFFDKVKDIALEVPYANMTVRSENRRLAVGIRNFRTFCTDSLNFRSEISAVLSGVMPDNVRVGLSLNGKISDFYDVMTTEIKFSLNTLDCGAYGIRNLNMVFSSLGNDWTVRKMADSIPFDVELTKLEDSLNLVFDGQMTREEIRRFISGNLPNDILPAVTTARTALTCSFSNIKDIHGKINLTAEGVKLPDNDVPVTAVLKVTAENSILNIEDCHISHDGENDALRLSGTVPLFGDKRNVNVIAERFRLHGLTLDCTAAVAQNKAEVTVSSQNLKCNNVNLGGFSYKINGNHPSGIISLDTVSPLNGYKVNGSIVRDSSGQYAVYIRHNPKMLSIGKILSAVGQKNIPFADNLYLNASVDTNIIGGKLVIPNSTAQIIKKADKTTTPVTAVFSMDGQKLTIRKMNILDGKVTLGGDVELSDKNVSGSLMTAVRGNDGKRNTYHIQASADSKNVKLNIGNSVRGVYNISSGKISLISNKFRLPTIGGREILMSCNVAADMTKKTLQESDITIENLALFNGKAGRLSGHLSYTDNTLSLTKLQYSDGSNNISGSMTNHLRDTAVMTKLISTLLKPKSDASPKITEINLDSLKLDGSGFFGDDAKKESYSLDYTIDTGNVEAKLYLTNMALNKLGNPNLSGLLNARVYAIGKLSNPTVEIQGDISKAEYNKKKLSGTFAAVKDANAVRVKRAMFSLGRHDFMINDSYMTLGQKVKNLSLNTTLNLKKFAKNIKTDLRINGSFEKFSSDTPFAFDAELKNINIAYLKGGVPFESEKFDSVKVSLRHRDGRYTLSNYGKKFIDFTADKSRKIIRGGLYKDKMPILTCVINTGNPDNLMGTIKLKQLPANIAHRIVYPFVRIDNGLLDGQITLSGTASDPKINGTASLYYGKVELKDYLPDPIANLTGIVVFADNKIYVNNVNGAVRKGLVHGNGEIVFNGSKFESFHFEVTSNTVPAKVVQGPVDAVGNGHIDSFTFDGHPGNYLIAGNVVLENAEVNLSNFGALAKSKKKTPVTYPVTVELNLITGDKVKVNYPIINVHIKPEQMLTLRYVGSEPAIYLGGEVAADKGELNYFNKEFKIENAAFTFYEDERKINPFVNLKSYYRTKDGKNSNVMVYLSINDRLSSFKTTVSAMPYKTMSEINSILGTNFATTEEDERRAVAEANYNYKPDLDTVANTTNYLSSSFMFSPVENTVKRMTGLDTFSLNTSIFGNMIKSNNNWLDLIDDTQLSFGKYLTNELYIGSVMSFQKLSNSGSLFIPFQDKNYGLNLELLMSLELPYLSIGYKFMPKDYSDILKSEHQISVEANFKF
ncbi:MAG: translocation/assembly module TamB domain-containing protein [Spirochaetales bacterium]|nr:translocation/assembly module TamB domain-containing protein [Spirochaetales bacterium]